MNSTGPILQPVAHYPLGGAELAPAAPAGKAAGRSAEAAARGLEETFLTILLKEMRQSLEPGGLFGNDSGDVHGGMFDQFMARHMAQAGGIGLARMLKDRLESANHTHAHAPPTHPRVA